MNNRISNDAYHRDLEEVIFITSPTIEPGTVELHGKKQTTQVTRKLIQVTEDWKIVSKQVMQMISSTEEENEADGYGLDEVSISLGFNAKGQLAFVAEAGVEASVSFVFKRK